MPGQKTPTPRRYAQAIFQLALEKGQISDWNRDLDRMVEFTENQSVVDLLESPGLSSNERHTVIKDTISEISDLGVNFMALLAGQRGLGLLPRIRQSLIDMFDTYQNIVRATVTTAIPLEKDEEARVVQGVKDWWKREVVLETKVDSTIIGGMIVCVGDQVIDGSIKGRIQSLRKQVRD